MALNEYYSSVKGVKWNKGCFQLDGPVPYIIDHDCLDLTIINVWGVYPQRVIKTNWSEILFPSRSLVWTFTDHPQLKLSRYLICNFQRAHIIMRSAILLAVLGAISVSKSCMAAVSPRHGLCIINDAYLFFSCHRHWTRSHVSHLSSTRLIHHSCRMPAYLPICHVHLQRLY